MALNDDVRFEFDVVTKEFSEMLMCSCSQLLNFLDAMGRASGDEQDSVIVKRFSEVTDKLFGKEIK